MKKTAMLVLTWTIPVLLFALGAWLAMKLGPLASDRALWGGRTYPALLSICWILLLSPELASLFLLCQLGTERIRRTSGHKSGEESFDTFEVLVDVLMITGATFLLLAGPYAIIRAGQLVDKTEVVFFWWVTAGLFFRLVTLAGHVSFCNRAVRRFGDDILARSP